MGETNVPGVQIPDDTSSYLSPIGESGTLYFPIHGIVCISPNHLGPCQIYALSLVPCSLIARLVKVHRAKFTFVLHSVASHPPPPQQ